uniref:Uncharacterized protein n=1 Tax=Heterorhabditis bacteriophora TaxID=37862 RepID=A0A1I7WEJ4_HETBA
MRIEEAWKAGFTGRGVSVSILVRPHMIRMNGPQFSLVRKRSNL